VKNFYLRQEILHNVQDDKASTIHSAEETSSAELAFLTLF
jgi:hypothetical protein